MTLQFQLDPVAEAGLQAAAEEKGTSPEKLAKTTLEEAFGVYRKHKAPNPEGIRCLLEELAEMGKGLPNLPDSAMTRESFYERD
jgi:hypothetical protein